MRNNAYGSAGDCVNTYYRNENPVSTTTYHQPAYSSYSLCTSSGYTGKKPKPLVTHAFSYDIVEWSLSLDGECVYHRPTYIESLDKWSGPAIKPTTVSPHPTSSEGNLYNEMLSEFSDRLRGSIDLSIDLGQSGQTIRQFKVTNSLVNYAETLSKRWGPAKLASGLWLEYVYGWKPIVSEIYEAAERSVNVVVNAIGSTKARKSWTDSNASLRVEVPYHGYFTIPGVKVKHSYSMSCAFRNRKNQSLSNYTSLNPVSIAWELLPYSFVVDWLINVGGYLRTVETAMLYGNDFVGGYLDHLVCSDADLRYAQKLGNGTSSSGSLRLSGHYRSRRFERSVLTSYPFPRTPTFDARLGSSRLFSAAALLAQHLGRR